MTWLTDKVAPQPEVGLWKLAEPWWAVTAQARDSVWVTINILWIILFAHWALQNQPDGTQPSHMLPMWLVRLVAQPSITSAWMNSHQRCGKGGLGLSPWAGKSTNQIKQPCYCERRQVKLLGCTEYPSLHLLPQKRESTVLWGESRDEISQHISSSELILKNWANSAASHS